MPADTRTELSRMDVTMYTHAYWSYSIWAKGTIGVQPLIIFAHSRIPKRLNGAKYLWIYLQVCLPWLYRSNTNTTISQSESLRLRWSTVIRGIDSNIANFNYIQINSCRHNRLDAGFEYCNIVVLNNRWQIPLITNGTNHKHTTFSATPIQMPTGNG